MKTRLPILVDRSVREAKASRLTIAENYEVQLRARLAEEGVNVACKKGCANCCYHPLYISLLEGVSLFQWLSDNGLWTEKLRQQFEAVSESVRELAPEVWALSLIPCPLLDLKNKTCRAYTSRPFSCRITFSIGDPEECHPHRLGPGRLPKQELFEGMANIETSLLKRHRLSLISLPLATAVLYGEKIARGEIELEDCTYAVLWRDP